MAPLQSCEFERQLPFYIRCRPAWMVLIDLSRKPDDTLRETPEVKKRDFKLTFQVSVSGWFILLGLITQSRTATHAGAKHFRGYHFPAKAILYSCDMSIFRRPDAQQVCVIPHCSFRAMYRVSLPPDIPAQSTILTPRY